MEKAKKNIIKSLKADFKKILDLAKNMNTKTKRKHRIDKCKILTEIIFSMAMGYEECADCILTKMDCPSCSFGSQHGVCISTNSDYMKMIESQTELVKAIRQLYL